jgi:hypothetical protein
MVKEEKKGKCRDDREEEEDRRKERKREYCNVESERRMLREGRKREIGRERKETEVNIYTGEMEEDEKIKIGRRKTDKSISCTMEE